MKKWLYGFVLKAAIYSGITYNHTYFDELLNIHIIMYTQVLILSRYKAY